MKQPTNTVKIRIGNQTRVEDQNQKHSHSQGTAGNQKTESKSNQVQAEHIEFDIIQNHPISFTDTSPSTDGNTPDMEPATNAPKVSLLEQVRERKKAHEQLTQDNIQQRIIDSDANDLRSSQNLAGSSYTSLPTSNLGRTQFKKVGRKSFVFTKNGKASTFAVLFGTLVGVLLGIGAYYMFTTLSQQSTPSNVGLASQDSKGQTISSQASNASQSTQPANSDASTTASAGPTKDELGPGGAAGGGTTVYLYQIGLFSDTSSLNQQVQTLKGKGIPTIQRGKQPLQLIAGAAPTKTGINSMNKLLQQATVDYYMKPFVVPTLPDQIKGVSDSSCQMVKQALQSEWDFVDSLLSSGKADNLTSVSQNVQDALQGLPATYSQATKDIQASLQDIHGIVGTNTGSSGTSKDPTQSQSYSLGKFYTEFAQGVFDLQS